MQDGNTFWAMIHKYDNGTVVPIIYRTKPNQWHNPINIMGDPEAILDFEKAFSNMIFIGMPEEEKAVLIAHAKNELNTPFTITKEEIEAFMPHTALALFGGDRGVFKAIQENDLRVLSIMAADSSNLELRFIDHRGVEFSVLQYVSAQGSGDALVIVLESGSFSENDLTEALEFACMDGNAENASILLEKGAISSEQCLRSATLFGHLKCVEILLANDTIKMAQLYAGNQDEKFSISQMVEGETPMGLLDPSKKEELRVLFDKYFRAEV